MDSGFEIKMTFSEGLKTLLSEPIRFVFRLSSEEIGLIIPKKAWIDPRPRWFGLARNELHVVLQFLFFVRYPCVLYIDEATVWFNHNPEADFLGRETRWRDLIDRIIRQTAIKFVEGLEDHALTGKGSCGILMTPSVMLARKKCGVADLTLLVARS